MFKNVLSLFLLLLLVSNGSSNDSSSADYWVKTDVLVQKFQVKKEVEIKVNPWEVFMATDTLNIDAYRVSWDQGFGLGYQKVEYCRVVFHNNKQRLYMLVAPWFSNKIVERANINNISFDKILIADIPDDYALRYGIKSAIIDTLGN